MVAIMNKELAMVSSPIFRLVSVLLALNGVPLGFLGRASVKPQTSLQRQNLRWYSHFLRVVFKGFLACLPSINRHRKALQLNHFEDVTKFPREAIENYVKQTLGDDEIGAHTYDHIERVLSLVLEMAEKMEVNIRVLGASALLHDIGRPFEKEAGKSHSILSGDMSVEILKTLSYSDSEIESVIQAIRTHRFSECLEPVNVEGKILSDADKLDAMGAIGVFRAIAQSSVDNRGIGGFLQHAHEKLLKLRDLMYTDIGKQMAQDRHKVLEEFVSQLEKEMGLVS